MCSPLGLSLLVYNVTTTPLKEPQGNKNYPYNIHIIRIPRSADCFNDVTEQYSSQPERKTF